MYKVEVKLTSPRKVQNIECCFSAYRFFAGLEAGFFAAGFEGFTEFETLPALFLATGAGFLFACADLTAGALAGRFAGTLAGSFAAVLTDRFAGAFAGVFTGGFAATLAEGLGGALAWAFLGAGVAWGVGFLAGEGAALAGAGWDLASGSVT